MEVLANIGLGMLGFFLGNLLFAKLGRWGVTLYEIATDSAGEGTKGVRLATAILLNSGPWLLVATGIFAYHVHSKSWAVWILIGAVTAIVFFGLITVHLARKAKRRGENAA